MLLQILLLQTSTCTEIRINESTSVSVHVSGQFDLITLMAAFSLDSLCFLFFKAPNRLILGVLVLENGEE